MLKKLYGKSELRFALAWILAYVVLASAGDTISEDLGIPKILTLPILMILSAILYFFVRKNGLTEKYGLCRPRLPAVKMLFYIPLLVLLTANLWYGVAMNQAPLETGLYILAMFCVGFLEEMIFRGLLFQAMARDGVKSAVIVSSITFGIGHIVNLFNGSGAELLPNLLQVMYAVAIGFAFVMIYCRTRSLMSSMAKSMTRTSASPQRWRSANSSSVGSWVSVIKRRLCTLIALWNSSGVIWIPFGKCIKVQ